MTMMGVKDDATELECNTSADGSDVSLRLLDENDKLNKRLLLLRDEYIKLQRKYLALQNRYDHLMVTGKFSDINDETNHVDSGGDVRCLSLNGGNFVANIVNFVGSLYNNRLYSDLQIDYGNGQCQLFAHKFVLKFRSQNWSVPDLDAIDRLYFPEMTARIVEPLFRWVYTGHIDTRLFDQEFAVELAKHAVRFELKPLVEQCEQWLLAYVQVENCIYFYQISEQLALSRLCDYAAKLVSIHWDSLGENDFANVSTPFLHRLFVEKSRYPLHKAIYIHNEDLIFLLLMDYEPHETVHKVNELDNLSQLPLDMALRTGQWSVAMTLLEHQANPNVCDSGGWPLSLRYLNERKWQTCRFLIQQGASVNSTTPENGDSLLHLCADCQSSDNNDMLDISRLLLERGADVNQTNCEGNGVLHRCIERRNQALFDLLLEKHTANELNLDLEMTNCQHDTPLAMAVELIDRYDDDHYAHSLLKLNVSLDTVRLAEPGDSLLNHCGRNSLQKAALFLVEHGANVNLVNNLGESILHLASKNGLKDLVWLLLEKNVNCNLVTLPSLNNDCHKDGQEVVYNQTALHLAILGGHDAIVERILSFHEGWSRKGCLDSALLTPDVDVKNSHHQTPMSLAVETGRISVAEMLIQAGADVNIKDFNGISLLQRMIQQGNDNGAQFLLEHGVDINARCADSGESYLECAIRHGRAEIVESLCQLGSNVHEPSIDGDSLLWKALKRDDSNKLAAILVQYDCDPNGWHQSTEGGFSQTLLHRALDENNQRAAIFLIQSGCDIHAIRKPGTDGQGKEDCDGQTPLHMACSWGMAEVVETLINLEVDANLVDQEGKTALHIAILNQNHQIIDLLLNYSACDAHKADNYGLTPFALAIKLKSRPTAQALCRRDCDIAEQRDGKGRTYLHVALQRNDYDAVLFLLDNGVNVNCRVADSQRKAPLHLAAETGSEIILRTLVLAGTELNVVTQQNQTALHLASDLDKYQMVEILLDMGIDASVQDSNGNTALHLAAMKAHHNTCRVLMERGSRPGCRPLDVRISNNRGHNVFHCLSTSANKVAASAIFEELVANFTDLDLDGRDNDGNTPLLLAYMNGNSKLCRSIVKEGAALGIRNHQGVSIFNHVMPTRQLLTSLLDSLARMPQWRDGPECLECGQKFNITNRRHHCRHCGRELCSRCSSKEILIMKFQSDKRSVQSRVCELCYDVLTLGAFN
ncbi:rabankyrin-5 [Dermatophagoides pteronyssinus]|uniref:rabankyrin-5 n=1 Tax=Dermatophagoides pteronyssinus TaxID=6956 RepID=UPI003F66621A